MINEFMDKYVIPAFENIELNSFSGISGIQSVKFDLTDFLYSNGLLDANYPTYTKKHFLEFLNFLSICCLGFLENKIENLSFSRLTPPMFYWNKIEHEPFSGFSPFDPETGATLSLFVGSDFDNRQIMFIQWWAEIKPEYKKIFDAARQVEFLLKKVRRKFTVKKLGS